MKEYLTAADLPVINQMLNKGNSVRIEQFYDGIKICQQTTKTVIQRHGYTERQGIPVSYRKER